MRNLVKRYRGGTDNAVDDISFDVADGQLFCLLGPNGAGKTTTVSVLTTTLTPSAGVVRIAGLELGTHQASIRRQLGIVFQHHSLDLNLTAEENIRLHAVLYGLYPWRPRYPLMPRRYREQVEELAGVLGVADILGRRARSLSGGTQRKLEIVRALMHHPRVLFLDEPTAGLDPESRRNLWAYLRDIRSQFGTTIFLTTHYLEEAEKADVVCVLAHGRVIESGHPAAIKARHAHPALVLDASDRSRLRDELVGLGVTVGPTAPLRIPLDGRSAQSVIRGIDCELSHIEIVQPTLEDVYLLLLDQARS